MTNITPTSVTAFVGYTAIAQDGNNPVLNTPVLITSVGEFEQHFGKAPVKMFDSVAAPAGKTGDFYNNRNQYLLVQNGGFYFLHSSIRFFFANGGKTCYVVSVGDYNEPVNSAALQKGIDQLIPFTQPALLVVPDAMCLAAADAYALQQYMLAHCATNSRFALLDIFDGWTPPDTTNKIVVIDDFRNNIGIDSLSYGAAYYPWMNALVISSAEISYQNFTPKALMQLLTDETNFNLQSATITAAQAATQLMWINMIVGTPTDPVVLEADLRSFSQLYNTMIKALLKKVNLLPLSGAMAGIYTTVDATKGVFKAPANIAVQAVDSPSVEINNALQQDMNVPLDGKSVNGIRTMANLGILVWGARTLDGNSADWRYINVKRTIIFIEQSIKISLQQFAFAPNTNVTWSAVSAMINSFLTGFWKQGGLCGANAGSAFNVNIGLGTTMSSDDMINGKMRVAVQVAILRPAEYIVLNFQQQMQTE